MKLTYFFSKPDRLVLERLEGDINLTDTIRAFQRLWKDPAYDPQSNVLMDIQEVNIQFGKSGLRELATFFTHMEKSAKGKIVAVIDAPMETAIGMMYQMEAGIDAIKIFNTLEDALAFLEVDPEVCDALDSDLAIVITTD